VVDVKIAYRDVSVLPILGVAVPSGPVLLDTNVFINALSGRGPAALKALLANLPLSLISGPVVAELSWAQGRLDPQHSQTSLVLAKIGAILSQIAPSKILVPSADQWSRSGRLAGAAARAVAGEARSIKTAYDRIELMNDAVTAIVASDSGATIVTQDRDFDIFMQLEDGLEVLFYA
jgi:predicted nucleic acid-binding protein